VIPPKGLYAICETARALLQGPHEVGRVIARPFVGRAGSFSRTSNRRDFAVPPPQGMLLDQLAAASVAVHAVGKISEIFLGRGIREHDKTKSNADGMAKTLAALDRSPAGLIFVNLVDFDMVYGHRNDAPGYAAALETFDAWLPQLFTGLMPDDLLILTADHGCDPTTPSTDHSREYVPLLVAGMGVGRGVNLGTRSTLADMGQTVAENFGVRIGSGESFLQELAPRTGPTPL
jgi:phosphopentomutase